MADYRVVARHVRYWRGNIHRWSTVWPLTGSLSGGGASALATNIYDIEDGTCYGGGSASNGGTYEIAVYAQASGGVPIYSVTYFDWETPADWIPYSCGYWATLAGAPNAVAENALNVTWLAGLSKSGKPVRFRKWFHAVKQSAATAGGQVDVSSADHSALVAGIQAGVAAISAQGLLLGNSSRLAAETPVVSQYFDNHQMPKGRKRPLTALEKQILKAAGSGGIGLSGEAPIDLG